MGRPSKYSSAFVEQARKLCELGATDEEIADFFKVSARTVYRWQAEHEEFCQALKAGKVAADDRVERSLYHRAVGYTFDSEKVFQFQGQIVRADIKEHVPPDTTAAIFWLKNRRPDAWRDVTKHEHEHEQVQRILSERPQTEEEWARAHGADLGAAAGAATRAH
jgi:hypothetical protein